MAQTTTTTIPIPQEPQLPQSTDKSGAQSPFVTYTMTLPGKEYQIAPPPLPQSKSSLIQATNVNQNGSSAQQSAALAAVNNNRAGGTAIVGVEPQQSMWKPLVEHILSPSLLIPGIFSGTATVFGLYKLYIARRKFARDSIEDLGVPHRGAYHCTGNPTTNQKISRLISSITEARNTSSLNETALICGSKDVIEILAAKALASQLEVPLLKIDCGKLANRSVHIPPKLLGTIAAEVKRLCKGRGAKYAVLLFDGIEKLMCSNNEEFVTALKKELFDKTGPLRKRSIVVGTLDEDAKVACSEEELKELDLLAASFASRILVEPPRTAEEIYSVIKNSIESILKYPSNGGNESGKELTEELKAALANYTLPEVDLKFLKSLSQAMPEIALDNRIYDLSRHLRNLALRDREVLTGDAFATAVLEFALEKVKNIRSKKYSDSKHAPNHAQIVASEAFAARVLNKTVMALGVQARSGAADVCRQRANLADASIKDLIDEAVLLEVRLSSQQRLSVGDNVFSAKIKEVNDAAAERDKIVSLATTALGKLFGHHQPEVIKHRLFNHVTASAKEILDYLSDSQNNPTYLNLVNQLAPGICDGIPVEITLKHLQTALEGFTLDRAAELASHERLVEQLKKGSSGRIDVSDGLLASVSYIVSSGS